MTEPPTAEGPQRSTLIAVGIAFLVGIVAGAQRGLRHGPAEIGVILLPILVVTALAVLGLLWAQRRGHLD